MPSFFNYLKPLGMGNPVLGKHKDFFSNFLTGTPEARENVSLLRPEQEPLYQQLVRAGLQPGAGGAFGTSADYYRGLLGENPADYAAFAAPEMRQFRENIVPELSEQFARGGGGQGTLSSSGFRNALLGAGTDLAERLGQIRANLRQAGAAGLAGIGQAGLGGFSQNMMTQAGSPGFLGNVAPAIGTGIGAAIGGPIGAGIGNVAGNLFGSSLSGNKVGANRSPYAGGNYAASPQIPTGNRFNLPNFSLRG